MSTGYIYENNIKYSNAGILPLLPKEIAFKIGERANQLMYDRHKKDIFTVFSQDLSINHYSWIESIGEDELEQLKKLNISNFYKIIKKLNFFYYIYQYITTNQNATKRKNYEYKFKF